MVGWWLCCWIQGKTCPAQKWRDRRCVLWGHSLSNRNGSDFNSNAWSARENLATWLLGVGCYEVFFYVFFGVRLWIFTKGDASSFLTVLSTTTQDGARESLLRSLIVRYHMELWRSLTLQLAISLAYASIFPITNLLGGGIMMLGIILSIPFLSIGWIVGMAFVQAFGSESAYLLGAFIAVAIQAFLLIRWLAAGRKNEANT